MLHSPNNNNFNLPTLCFKLYVIIYALSHSPNVLYFAAVFVLCVGYGMMPSWMGPHGGHMHMPAAQHGMESQQPMQGNLT